MKNSIVNKRNSRSSKLTRIPQGVRRGEYVLEKYGKRGISGIVAIALIKGIKISVASSS